MNEVLDREEIMIDGINIEDIDIEGIKNELIQKYGSAIFSVHPIARVDYDRVKDMTDPKEILEEAKKAGINIDKYIYSKTR